MIETIVSAAYAVGISPILLLSVCFTESGLRNVTVPADGSSSSIGVCQMKLETARFTSRVYKLHKVRPSSLMKPAENAKFAAHYLKWQLSRYRGKENCAIEAYNRGTAGKCKSIYVKRVRTYMKKRPWEVVYQNNLKEENYVRD
jgi:hypothetical protein